MDFSKITKSPIVLKEENKRYAFDPSKEMRGYLKVQQDEDIFPSREVIDKGEVYHDLGADLDAYYSASWKEIKS